MTNKLPSESLGMLSEILKTLRREKATMDGRNSKDIKAFCLNC